MVETKGRHDVSLMMDSGAYSAWVKQEKIDVNEYGKFILKYSNEFDIIINLDVIPGKWGQKSIPEQEMLKSIEEGWDNYYRLIEMGVPKSKLVHIFHQGEPFHYLEKMADEMEYIGISPANDRTTKEKKKWLDECMKYVVDSKGNVKVKFHGFGMTSLHLIWRYPWFSIDSTTWVLVGAMGGVMMPKTKFGRYTYRESPIILPITTKNDIKKPFHYQNLSEIEQSKVNRYFKERGFTAKALEEDGLDRDRINMRFFLDLEQTLTNTKVYFAGNFPMLHKMEREFKTMDLALKISDKWRRLGSYYHQNYLLKLLDLKRRKDEPKKVVRRIKKS
ncbi:MAG: hypothetical protein GY797_38415 [Deltaproteobacteria bacterium]|nr:hypothetical protein [Deltaproteobacteria bacterium]